jgi:hypothetical protein
MLGGEERAMRRVIAALAVAAAGLVIAPAAEAHHLDQDTSDAVCVLAGNVPTFVVTANYKDFSRWDLPVYWSASIDKATVGGGALTWVGPDYAHAAQFTTSPGTHDFVYQASWNNGENGGYIKRTRSCPTPVPPPPPAPPVVTPPPPPPVVIVCNTKPMPAACGPQNPPVKPCGCKPQPPRCVAGHYRITVQPRHINHGRVTFRLVGSRTSHVRWYVDHRRHGVRGHAWERTTHQGRRWWVYLWVPDVWTSSMWGRHRVTVTFNTPCGHRKLTMSYFNHDPLSAEAQRELARAFHV